MNKQALVSWYGITDFKAALGVIDSKGPVCSAITNHTFDVAMILGYTDPSKADMTKESWEKKLLGIKDQRQLAHEDKQILELANTKHAHKYFQRWLESQIAGCEIKAKVSLFQKTLDHLNDAEGINAAAVKIIQLTRSLHPEHRITAHLSPGTPVMAYVWAKLCNENPHLNLHAVSSSESRLRLDYLELPNQTLAKTTPVHRPQPSGQDRTTTFDLMIHLIGDEKQPFLLGVAQFKADRHLFVSSNSHETSHLVKFVNQPSESRHLKVDPYNPKLVKTEISKAILEFNSPIEIGFNLTGGTKLMFAGALAACKLENGTPFYFDGSSKKMIYLHDSHSIRPKGVSNVEDFFTARGYEVKDPGLWSNEPSRTNRIDLTQRLFRERSNICKIYGSISFTSQNHASKPFDKKTDDGKISASLTPCNVGTLQINKKVYRYENCPDFGSYVGGGWFEEYVYLQLNDLKNSGHIKDLRIGMKLDWADESHSEARYPMNELDIVFTDGYHLFIVECKAGKSSKDSDIYYKLDSIISKYGGQTTRGILASALGSTIPKHTQKRIRASKYIKAIAGNDIREWIESFKP